MMVRLTLYGEPLDGKEVDELEIRCRHGATFQYWADDPKGGMRLVRYGTRKSNEPGGHNGWAWHYIEGT